MQLRIAFCYALLAITMTVTCTLAEGKVRDKEEQLPEKKITKRIATLVVDDVTPVGRVFQQPKVIYRRLAKKSYNEPPTYGSRRTKYGPPRTSKKPSKKYRSKKGSKPHYPYPYKKRAPRPRYIPPKRNAMKPVYGSPKKHHRIYNGIGFGEPPTDYTIKKYRPPKPSKLTRTKKPEYSYEISSISQEDDFASPATFSDNFSKKPFVDDFWPQQQFEPVNIGYGEPPVDSYGDPIKPSLHDLTFPTAQTYLESTSHLDEDRNFGPQSRPWSDFQNEPEYAYTNIQSKFTEPKLTSTDIFVTPTPEEQNQELHLNSYSDIFNYRQKEKAKQEKKKKTNHQKNIKMLNQPWLGTKSKDQTEEEIIVGGQYAEPPARHISKLHSSLFIGDGDFPSLNNNQQRDTVAPISSYVNYKNSNMAFSPQNLNDAFSIVDK